MTSSHFASALALLFVASASSAQAQECSSSLLPDATGQLSEIQFGHALALDGSRALVSAPRETSSGAVSVFERGNFGWFRAQRLTPSDAQFQLTPQFGSALALQGDLALIGSPRDDSAAPDAGAVYVFERGANGWQESAKLTSPGGEAGALFGAALALDGERVLIGAPLSNTAALDGGAAFIFERQAGAWSWRATFAPGNLASFDGFGRAVALSGSSAVVGAPLDDSAGLNAGSVRVYERQLGVWSESGRFFGSSADAGDNFGHALSASGERFAVGSPRDNRGGIAVGSVLVFERGALGWSESERLFESSAPGPGRFGQALALEGTRLAVGDNQANFGAGAAFLFEATAAGWSESRRLTPRTALDSQYGHAVDVVGGTLLVGAPRHFANVAASGAAFVHSDGGYEEFCPATANSTAAPARFGLSGSTSVGAGQLTLTASSVPSGALGVFLYGDQRTQVPMGGGQRCIEGQVRRMSLQTAGPDGVLRQDVDYSSAPGLQPGSTWHFQAWFRDSLAPEAANTSSAATITFCP